MVYFNAPLIAIGSFVAVSATLATALTARQQALCLDLDGPRGCYPDVPVEEWTICCNWDGDWACCNGAILSGGTYYIRVFRSTGWEYSSIVPEWHDVHFLLPQCILPDGGCELGPEEHESCSPAWTKKPLANPCP
jgi:hypothetical protein